MCPLQCVLASLVPPFFINSVVALGAMHTSAPTRGAAAPRLADSRYPGFFYAYLFRDDPDPSKRKYEAFLVTANHVVRDFILNNRALERTRQPEGRILSEPPIRDHK